MAFQHEHRGGFERMEEHRGGFGRPEGHRGWFGGLFGRGAAAHPGEPRRGWWGRWFGHHEVIREQPRVAPPAEVAPPIEIGAAFGGGHSGGHGGGRSSFLASEGWGDDNGFNGGFGS